MQVSRTPLSLALFATSALTMGTVGWGDFSWNNSLVCPGEELGPYTWEGPHRFLPPLCSTA